MVVNKSNFKDICDDFYQQGVKVSITSLIETFRDMAKNDKLKLDKKTMQFLDVYLNEALKLDYSRDSLE